MAFGDTGKPLLRYSGEGREKTGSWDQLARWKSEQESSLSYQSLSFFTTSDAHRRPPPHFGFQFLLKITFAFQVEYSFFTFTEK